MFSIVPFHVKFPAEALADNSSARFFPDLTIWLDLFKYQFWDEHKLSPIYLRCFVFFILEDVRPR